MYTALPAIIMSFREGLEALLILMLIFQFLKKTDRTHLNRSVGYGFLASVAASVMIGGILFLVGSELETMGAVWESITSLIAVGLVTTFIIWMIRHSSAMKDYVEHKASLNVSRAGIFTLSFVLVLREGVEIALFVFAGQYQWFSVIIGLCLAAAVALGIYYSLLQTSINVIFKVTLVYLIIQSGYLLGYGIHEGLEALESLSVIDEHAGLLQAAYNLSDTVLDHKAGVIGLPLNILLGWSSKPQWLQLISQYLFTISVLWYWWRWSQRPQTAAR